MEEELLTKERLEAFVKEKETIETLLKKRGDEILEIASEWGVNLHVSGCDKIHYYDDCFYIVEEWSCRGESGSDSSQEIPLDALFTNEALRKFLDEKKQEKIDMEKRRERDEYEKDLKEFERLKSKLGK